MSFYDFRIGAGNGLALASLTNIEDVSVNGRKYVPPRAYGTYRVGARRLRLNMRLYHAGTPSVSWIFSGMTRAQFRSLQTTYCSNGYDGLVTIYTKTDQNTTYTRYSATMMLPELPDLDLRVDHFANVTVTFVSLVAL